jgi:hypothetical protein
MQRRLKHLVVLNFICSILLVVASAIYRLVDASYNYRAYEIAHAFPGRSLFGLGVLGFMEVYLLIRFVLRNHLGSNEPRLIAGVFGFVGLTLCFVVRPLAASIYGGPLLTWFSLGLLYVSFGHVLYAFLGKEDV